MGRIDRRTDILRLIVNFVTAVSTGVEVGIYSWEVKKYASRYFFRISRLVKCNFTSQWSFPWPTDWSWLSTKAATQVSEFNLLTVMFVWVDYRSGIREKNANKFAFLVCNLNFATRVQGNYNAFWFVQGGIESVLRVTVVFSTTYESHIYLTTYVWFILINFSVLLIFFSLTIYNSHSHLLIFGHT